MQDTEQTIGHTKVCTRCGEAKAVDEFYKHKGGKFGIGSTCKSCSRAKTNQWRIDNPEKALSYKRAYNEASADKIRELDRNRYWSDPEAARAKRREYYQENIDRERTRSREAARMRKDRVERYRAYYKKNREKILSKLAEERRVNPEKSRSAQIRKMAKKLATPQGKLESSMRTYVCKSLKTGVKGGRRTFKLLGYTSSDLKDHLERQFLPGMTWENYGRGAGKWNIDHIIPVSLFKYETPEEDEFRRCWALNNLRPMWAIDNIKKGAKIITSPRTTTTIKKTRM